MKVTLKKNIKDNFDIIYADDKINPSIISLYLRAGNKPENMVKLDYEPIFEMEIALINQTKQLYFDVETQHQYYLSKRGLKSLLTMMVNKEIELTPSGSLKGTFKINLGSSKYNPPIVEITPISK